MANRFSVKAGSLVMTLLTAALSQAGSAAAGPAAEAPRAAAMQPILQQDERLQARVTLRLKRTPLSGVAAELGRQIGVTLTAAPEVADEPTIVYATEQAARDVMHHLATLFHYRWRRKGTPGKYAYEIYQDLPSKQEEETLREQDRLRALEGLRDTLRSYLARSQQPPETLTKQAEALEAQAKEAEAKERLREAGDLRRQAGQHRAMTDPLWRALARVPALLTPEQWSALVDGEILRFSTRGTPGKLPLPAALARELHAAKPWKLPPGWAPDPNSPWDEVAARQREREDQEAWARAEEIHVHVWLEQVLLSNAAWATLHIRPTVRMPEGFSGNRPSPHALQVYGRQVLTPDPRTAAVVDPSWASDPILGVRRPIRLESTASGRPDRSAGRLNRLLPRIAETYGVNLVADAYRQPRYVLQPPPLEGEPPLYEVLNRWVLSQAGWSRQGAFVHVRCHMWYRVRLGDIPDRVAKRWSDRLRQARRLSLEDAVELALTLRDEQLKEFEAVMGEEAGIRLSWVLQPGIAASKEILRAYGNLLPGQRQQLLGGGRVVGAAMPAEARRWLHAALRERQRFDIRFGAPAMKDEPPEVVSHGLFSMNCSAVERITGQTPDGIRTTRFRSVDARTTDGATPAAAGGAAVVGTNPIVQVVSFRYQPDASQTVEFGVTMPVVELESESRR